MKNIQGLSFGGWTIADSCQLSAVSYQLYVACVEPKREL